MTGFVVQGHILHFTIVWVKNTTVFSRPLQSSAGLSVSCIYLHALQHVQEVVHAGEMLHILEDGHQERGKDGDGARQQHASEAGPAQVQKALQEPEPVRCHTCPNIMAFNEPNALGTHIPPSQTDPSRFRSWLNSVQRRGSRWPKYTAQPGRKNSPEPHPSNTTSFTSTQRSYKPHQYFTQYNI